MVNKPAGVVSTAREPGRRQAVVELVDSKRRLYPVGSLDADSTGLILLTNDGELANRLTHPRYGVKRSYRVRLRRPASEPQLRRLRRGVELDDGPTAPAGVRRVSPRVLELTIAEGRNRQVRRMVEAVGNEVVKLARIRFGSIEPGRAAGGEGPAAPPPGGPAALERCSRCGAMRRAPVGRPGRGQGRQERRRGDPHRHRGVDARVDVAQRARAGADRELPVHRPPTT